MLTFISLGFHPESREERSGSITADHLYRCRAGLLKPQGVPVSGQSVHFSVLRRLFSLRRSSHLQGMYAGSGSHVFGHTPDTFGQAPYVTVPGRAPPSEDPVLAGFSTCSTVDGVHKSTQNHGRMQPPCLMVCSIQLISNVSMLMHCHVLVRTDNTSPCATSTSRGACFP